MAILTEMEQQDQRELQALGRSQSLVQLRAHKPFSALLIQYLTENKMKDFALDVREKFVPNNKPNYSLIISEGTAMPALRKLFEFRNTVKIISVMLGNLCGSFNVSKNMSPDQIADYAMEIVETHMHGSVEEPSMRLEDFAVFFQLAKNGRYGKPFDYVDAALIEKWLTEYYSQRMDEIHAAHERIKDQGKESRVSREIDWEQDPDKKLERRLNDFSGKMNSMKDHVRRKNND